MNRVSAPMNATSTEVEEEARNLANKIISSVFNDDDRRMFKDSRWELLRNRIAVNLVMSYVDGMNDNKLLSRGTPGKIF